ncbi:DUF2283 domain-containing protein [Candidatus Woesearchaeota archaeon]|nr:DUF2283 domain-containing protein [Candidatus Woesearchaeota archaeon]
MKLTEDMQIHHDEEGDFLEIRIGKPTKSYFNQIGDDLFERIDEKTGKIKGFAIFNFKKRTEHLHDINVSLPLKLEITS